METKTDNNPKRISSLAPAIQRWGWITLLFYILQLLHFYWKYCIIIAIIAGEEHHEYPLHVESFAMDWDKIGTADRSGSKVIIEFILHLYCIFIVFIAFIAFIAFKSKYCIFSLMQGWCRFTPPSQWWEHDCRYAVEYYSRKFQQFWINSFVIWFK